jgi:hypothetical protein
MTFAFISAALLQTGMRVVHLRRAPTVKDAEFSKVLNDYQVDI